MKVYLVRKYYDNGMSYDESFSEEDIEVVCATREKAIDYINSVPLENGWIEGNPYPSYPNKKVLRQFYKPASCEYDEPEIIFYSIREMEVLN